MLLRLNNLDSFSVEEIYERFGEPQKQPVVRVDGAPTGPEAPTYTVAMRPLINHEDGVIDPYIMISDFGEAWIASEKSQEELNIPSYYMCPEATFAKDHIGKPADVWSLACTLFEILGNRPLFKRQYFFNRDDNISEMVSTLGILPQQWWESWEARGEFYNEDGSCNMDSIRLDTLEPEPLLQRIQQHRWGKDGDFSGEEAISLERMLRAMLIYNPQERATAENFAESDWMKRWGRPALEKLTGKNSPETRTN